LIGDWCSVSIDPPITLVSGDGLFKPYKKEFLHIPMESGRIVVGEFRKIVKDPNDAMKFTAEVRLLGYKDELDFSGRKKTERTDLYRPDMRS
jgi:hypothetical protein